MWAACSGSRSYSGQEAEVIATVPLDARTTLAWTDAGSDASTAPWSLNSVAVGAIASAVSVMLATAALIVAVRTYINNSRAAIVSQAALVSAYRTRNRATKTVDGVIWRLIEVQITNSSNSDVFDLSLLLRTTKRTRLIDTALDIESVSQHRRGKCGRWTLEDGAVIPPGVSILRFFVTSDHFGDLVPIWSHVGIGFIDRNGRNWTRQLDGDLSAGWEPG